MKLTFPVLAALAAVLAVVPVIAASSPAAAKNPRHKHYVAKKGNGPLRGIIYGNQRRGGYSYHYSDVVEAGRRSNPAVSGLYPSGPLDGDFFFATPRGPFGGYTPYMH